MDRYWLLNSTTYGTWLPGDERGFVSPVPEVSGPSKRHNTPGTDYDQNVPGFHKAARAALKGEPVYLNKLHAQILLDQFRETASYRKWQLLAAAIMANHFHIVVGVPGDPDPTKLLADFKSYGSRALNKRWTGPASGTWWTESGSRRKLPNEKAVRGAIDYVKQQPFALLVHICDLESPGERGA